MKQMLLLALGLLLFASVAGAAEFVTSGATGGTQAAISNRTPVVITQNFDPTFVGTTQVACGVSGLYTTQNWFLRRFFLADDHGIASALTVQSVDIGVELCSAAFIVDVVLFELGAGDPFTFGMMTEVARQSVSVGPGDDGTIVNVPISATIADPVGTDLVVAIDAPDGSVASVRFYPGANEFGALWDAYIAAEGCGISEPTSVTSIGFPDSQTIFVVYGDEGGGTPVEETSWGAVKNLYR